VRAASNSISYIVLLGISLVLVAYSLNVFLKFQSGVREPMRASVTAVKSASDGFMAAVSGGIDGGVFLSSGNYSLNGSGNLSLGIEGFPPYTAGSPALLQVTFINTGPGLILVSDASVSVIKGNITVYSKGYSSLAVGYKLSKGIVFTPESEGEYIVKASAGGASAESSITVIQYGRSKGRGIYGSRNFTVLGLEQDIFSYDLRERRFDAEGSGSRWNVSIPAGFWFDSFDFIDFQKNSSLPYISGQLVAFNSSRFQVSEGSNAFSSSAGLSIPVGRSADFLDLLVGSTCAGGLNITLSYPTEDFRLPLAYNRDICKIGSGCPAPGVVFQNKHRRIPLEHLELQVVSVSLQGRLESVSFSPDCGFVLAGASLRNHSWHQYGNASSVFLFIEKTGVQHVNGMSLDGKEEEGRKAYDVTDDVMGGAREFLVETDRDVSAPYLLYAEVLNSSVSNYSLPDGLIESSVRLGISLPYWKEAFEKGISFASNEEKTWLGGGYDYEHRDGSWRFGSVFRDSPEFSIGLVSKNMTADYGSDERNAVIVRETINQANMLLTEATRTVRVGRAFVLERPGRETSFGLEYSHGYGSAGFSASDRLEAYFGAVELQRFGIVLDRNCPYCEISRQNSETLSRSFNFTVPPEVIGAYVLVNSDVPNYNCYDFAGDPSSSFSLELIGRAYSASSYASYYCGYYMNWLDALSLRSDISGLLLPGQAVFAKASLYTSSFRPDNGYPHTGGNGEIVFVKRKPLRMDGREFYADSLVPLSSSFRFRGTGRVSGSLDASYLEGGPVAADVGFFRSALLVLEPEAGVDGLEVLVNGRRVRNSSVLLLPERVDVSDVLVPLGRNVLDFSGRNGSLGWRLVLD